MILLYMSNGKKKEKRKREQNILQTVLRKFQCWREKDGELGDDVRSQGNVKILILTATAAPQCAQKAHTLPGFPTKESTEIRL